MLVLLILSLLSINLFAQDSSDVTFISYDTLRTKNINIEYNWKLSAENDSSFKEINFDDSNWLINSSSFNNSDSAKKYFDGNLWLRKKIRVDSGLVGKSYLFSANLIGAAEIYINGKEIKKYGVISDNPDSEKVYRTQGIPFPLSFNDGVDYTIAIHYSNLMAMEDLTRFISWYGPVGVRVQLKKMGNSVVNLVNNLFMQTSINFAIAGMFLSLTLLYLILYFFYSKQKENLFYSLFTLSLSLTFFAQEFNNLVFERLILVKVFSLLNVFAAVFIFLFYLLFIYAIFYDKPPKQIFLFIGLTLISLLALFMPDVEVWLNPIIGVFFVLASLEGLRVIYIAFKEKKDHAKIIGIGVIIFGCLILFITSMNIFGYKLNSIYTLIFFISGLFSLPASMSVYQAKKNASDNRRLEKQLTTIKELSAKELKIQEENSNLLIEAEKEKAAKQEVELRAHAAELQAKAAEAERRALEAENERQSNELEEARQLQLSLLPKIVPELPNLKISVYMQTATEVGGDYYDFNLSEDGKLTVVVGDATGHGLKAGTMVTATKSLVNANIHRDDLVETFHSISSNLKKLNFRLLSMCLMILKIKNNKIDMTSAGMPPALIYRTKEKIVEEIALKGMPLGVSENFPYQSHQTQLEKDDCILLMSDGFPELFNDNKELLGYDRCKTEFMNLAHLSGEEIINGLVKKTKEWHGDLPPDDDVTFVVLKAM